MIAAALETTALVLALTSTGAVVVYGLFAWERIVRRHRERLPGSS